MNNEKNTRLIEKFANQYSVEPNKLKDTLIATVFSQGTDKHGKHNAITNEQMMTLLVVADQYKLNPFTKEIYAFPFRGGIVPVVGVDGWARIINNDKNFDGMEFNEAKEMKEKAGAKACPDWIECIIYKKNTRNPTKIKEYLDEAYKATDPWKSHTKRMLRHKAMIQCARYALDYSGIKDPDEADRIIEGEIMPINPTLHSAEPPKTKTEALKQKLSSTIVEENPIKLDITNIVNTAKTEEELEDALDLVRELPNEEQATTKEMVMDAVEKLNKGD